MLKLMPAVVCALAAPAFANFIITTSTSAFYEGRSATCTDRPDCSSSLENGLRFARASVMASGGTISVLAQAGPYGAPSVDLYMPWANARASIQYVDSVVVNGNLPRGTLLVKETISAGYGAWGFEGYGYATGIGVWFENGGHRTLDLFYEFYDGEPVEISTMRLDAEADAWDEGAGAGGNATATLGVSYSVLDPGFIGTITSVPEPAPAALILVGGVAIWWRRSRRRSSSGSC